MKKNVVIFGVLAAIGIFAWGVWFFVFSGNLPGASLSSPGGSLPGALSILQSGTSAPVRSIASQKNPDVADAFLRQIQNADQITLGGTIVVPPYALQIWGDANKGGEALLQNAPSSGWTLLSLGGGEWSSLGLIQVGVPHTVAQQLVAGLTGETVSPVAAPVPIPAGDTIVLGTAQGGVMMSNFYKSADYIAQDQNAVVIQQSSTYSIVYNISDSSFIITIFTSQFTVARQTAESAFLNSLKISQQDACQLAVSENVPGGASSQYVGQALRLSFCR